MSDPPTPRPRARRARAAAGAQALSGVARKYRPQSFGALIGQDAMVRTSAMRSSGTGSPTPSCSPGSRGRQDLDRAADRKALNLRRPDGTGGPTIEPCGVCEPCVAIAEGRHIDVIEMDAASHTGVDDVREIIEAVRYAAVSARYKVYIVDEVHMLSKNAFNALLKTLEEPPAHVKFLFATTEVNKVPVTVLSRCQRFEMGASGGRARRHFGAVAKAEGARWRRARCDDRPGGEGSARAACDHRPGYRHGRGGVTADRCARGRPVRPRRDRRSSACCWRRQRGALALVRDQYDLGSSLRLWSAPVRASRNHPRPGRRSRGSGPVRGGEGRLRRLGEPAVLRRHPPALAIAAQGPGRGPFGADAARGRRDGPAPGYPRHRAARSRHADGEAGERRGGGGARAGSRSVRARAG